MKPRKELLAAFADEEMQQAIRKSDSLAPLEKDWCDDVSTMYSAGVEDGKGKAWREAGVEVSILRGELQRLSADMGEVKCKYFVLGLMCGLAVYWFLNLS